MDLLPPRLILDKIIEYCQPDKIWRIRLGHRPNEITIFIRAEDEKHALSKFIKNDDNLHITKHLWYYLGKDKFIQSFPGVTPLFEGVWLFCMLDEEQMKNIQSQNSDQMAEITLKKPGSDSRGIDSRNTYVKIDEILPHQEYFLGCIM